MVFPGCVERNFCSPRQRSKPHMARVRISIVSILPVMTITASTTESKDTGAGLLRRRSGSPEVSFRRRRFRSFQQNVNPVSGQKLTPRNNPNSIRFYDFQCSAQKSVSVLSLFDSRLVEAHRKAVESGMKELERFAAVRIRKGDHFATKNFAYTGKFIYAQYHHDTSRLLDPQLHTHM